MATRRIRSRVLDFSGGAIGGVSDYLRRVRHGRIIENCFLRPLGALGVRSGSQRLSSATLTKKPHSCAEWVSTSGAAKAFIGAEDAAGVLYEATTGAFTVQTTPYGLNASAKQVYDQLHATVWMCEQAGAAPPIFYRSGNPANTWHSGILPRPAFPAIPAGTAISGAGIPAATTVNASVNAGDTSLTMSANATASANVTVVIGSGTAQFSIPNVQTTAGNAVIRYQSAGAAAGLQMTLAAAAGGSIPVGSQPYYRLRFRYSDGSSRSNAPLQLGAPIAGPNQTVNLTNIANEIRSDYLGWTLERTKSGGLSIGPFYFVADGTGTTYSDAAADSDLGDVADENVHGEPPHFNGIVAYKDRLVGWVGATLWFSQSVGDIEATGIANWNALNASDIGPDDGDAINAVVVQVDRLAVLKRWSAWAVEGDDITNFRAFPLGKGAGASGPRAACVAGATVYFWGDAGMHRIRQNIVEPFGWTEQGHTFAKIKAGQYGDVVLKNYLGQHLLMFFSTDATYNDDGLAYDLRFGGWVAIKGWYVADLLVQKAGAFGNAQAIVMVDRRDLDAGAGFDYPVWLGFYGFKDEKASNGTGGIAPSVVVETPKIDDGMPDVDKEWERIQGFIEGDSVTVNLAVLLDPPGSASVTLVTASTAALWGAVTWGAFNWASSTDSEGHSGLPRGTVGRRYAVRMTCSPPGEFVFKGYTMDGILQPGLDYSRT